MEKFIQICKSGKAPERYSLHDTIAVPYGDSQKITFEIVAFNESGTKVTLVSKECLPETHNLEFMGSGYGHYQGIYYGYRYTNPMRTLINGTVLNSLPTILQSNMVPLTKTYLGYHDGPAKDVVTGETSNTRLGERYTESHIIWIPNRTDATKYYSTDEQRIKKLLSTDTPVLYTTADDYGYQINSTKYHEYSYVLINGALQKTGSRSYDYYAPIGICL